MEDQERVNRQAALGLGILLALVALICVLFAIWLGSLSVPEKFSATGILLGILGACGIAIAKAP